MFACARALARTPHNLFTAVYVFRGGEATLTVGGVEINFAMVFYSGQVVNLRVAAPRGAFSMRPRAADCRPAVRGDINWAGWWSLQRFSGCSVPSGASCWCCRLLSAKVLLSLLQRIRSGLCVRGCVCTSEHAHMIRACMCAYIYVCACACASVRANVQVSVCFWLSFQSDSYIVDSYWYVCVWMYLYVGLCI